MITILVVVLQNQFYARPKEIGHIRGMGQIQKEQTADGKANGECNLSL